MRASRREVLAWAAAIPAARALASFGAASDIETLVLWIRSTPREAAVRRGARELRAGLSSSTLLGALLVSAAREIRPDSANFNHAALVVSSIDQLAAGATEDERIANALWCLDSFKQSQEREAATLDWKLAAMDSRRAPGPLRAREEFVDALERWDAAAADAAIAGFVRSAPLDAVYELVWEYGTRCRSNIGHKAIYAAQSRRALSLAGNEFAEDVLRSVVASYFPDGRSKDSEPFEKSRAILAQGFARAAPRPATDLGAARELLAELRRADAGALPATVAKLIGTGAHASTLWDAVVIAASELCVQHAGIGPLHVFTSTNALHHIGTHASTARVADLALMQAAAWSAQFRDAMPKSSIGAPPPDRSAEESESFRRSAASLVRARADEVHEFKMAAAALEESRLAGDWARPAALAALATHLPDASRKDGETLQRIRDAIAVAR